MDSFDIDDIVLDIVPLIALGAVETVIAQAQEQEQRVSRIPRSTGQKGGDYLQELLNCGSDKRIYDVLRMQKGTFQALCTRLRKDRALKDSHYIRIEEQVAMFLWTLNYSASSRTVAERFQHSREPISRYVLYFYYMVGLEYTNNISLDISMK
jgi:hypothetical protein